MLRITILSLAIALLVSCTPTKKESVTEEKTKPAEYITADPGLPFSKAVIYDGIIYVAGQVGEIDMKLVEGGIGPETQQTMLNIRKILEENGSSMDQVIKCTCMLADIAEWGDMNAVYTTFFPNHKPARSALGASGLALNARVEIECMAYISQ
ncbi:MAG: RidA family protein [Cyclobacteriaceae bacterium]|nr:RidA family protein [Cyclobacteriaceae bacterium SS2]